MSDGISTTSNVAMQEEKIDIESNNVYEQRLPSVPEEEASDIESYNPHAKILPPVPEELSISGDIEW